MNGKGFISNLVFIFFTSNKLANTEIAGVAFSEGKTRRCYLIGSSVELDVCIYIKHRLTVLTWGMPFDEMMIE